MDRDPDIPISANELIQIEELEERIAPDSGETVNPLGFKGRGR